MTMYDVSHDELIYDNSLTSTSCPSVKADCRLARVAKVEIRVVETVTAFATYKYGRIG